MSDQGSDKTRDDKIIGFILQKISALFYSELYRITTHINHCCVMIKYRRGHKGKINVL